MRLGTPIGRAAWLKPKWLRVRLPPWALVKTRLGSVGNGRPLRLGHRRAAVVAEMLWVRVPPELLEKNDRPRGAAWSARDPVTVEIAGSNPAGDALKTARYANWQSGHRPRFARCPTLVNCGFDSRLRHCTKYASVGHRQAQVAVTHPPSGFAGSTPARRTGKQHGPFVYRFRTRAPQARRAGSIPARVTDGQVVQLEDTRRSERRPLAGVGVRVSPRLLMTI